MVSKRAFQDEHEFRDILNANITPARPVDSPELLQGREALLREIGRALASPGMNVFIHGERGVGKTSLALTAALDLTYDKAYVGLEKATTFASFIRDVCSALIGSGVVKRDLDITGSTSLNLWVFKLEGKLGGSGAIGIGDIESVNEAASAIIECTDRSQRKVLVIDEMDRVEDPSFRPLFAELIKRLHDRQSRLKLIMCGIGSTLEEIIGSHLSASRAITPFGIPPISYDARWRIIQNAADKLGFTINREYIIRISQISDGYPYYVHLIGFNLLWAIFDHYETSLEASSDDFHAAVIKSIERAESPLREAYKFAIQKTKNSFDYEEALWSLAESTHFERQIKDVYDQSYSKVVAQRKLDSDGEIPPKLDIEQFRQRLYRLCEDRHGQIIKRTKNSWYAFGENVMRGYVRLVAHRNGVILGDDHH